MGRIGWPMVIALVLCSCANSGPVPKEDNPTPNPAPAPAAGPCVPKTCGQLHATCGDIGDGCGNTLTCGICGPGQSCAVTAGGQSCTASSCVPRTCDEVGARCGVANDGCGGTLQCGGCGTGETCGGGGVPNQCGAAAGTIRWGQVLAGVSNPVGPQLAAGPSGLVLGFGSGDPSHAHLRLFDVALDGGTRTERGSSSLSAPADALLALAGTGSLDLVPRLACDGGGCAKGSFGGQETEGPTLLSSPKGDVFAWQHPLGAVTALGLAADGSGEALILTTVSGGPAELSKLDPAGNVLWSVKTAAQAVATDTVGNVFLAGHAKAEGAVANAPPDWKVSEALFVARLSPGGRPAWQRAWLGCTGQMGAIEATDTVVVATGLIAGECTVAGVQIHIPESAPQPFVVAIDPSGMPKWAALPSLSSGKAPPLLAVGPNGQVALAAPEGGMQVFDASGAPSWARLLPGVPTALAAHPSGDWLVAGHSETPLDFGDAGGTDGGTVPQVYLIDLRP